MNLIWGSVMTRWSLNSEGKYGIKKISDTELGRTKGDKGTGKGIGSGQTHIGLSDNVLKFLPTVTEPIFRNAKLFYDNRISDVKIKWKLIKTKTIVSSRSVVDSDGSILYLRSPSIDKGLESESPTLTKFIIDEASGDNTTEWYLIFFGLKCNIPMFILIKQGSELHQLATDCGLIQGSNLRTNNFDEPFFKILEYINDHTGVSFTMATHNVPKNQILFGPPGTGKTYITAEKAVSIIEEKERCSDDPDLRRDYLKHIKEERLGFVTFHQSYAYEDFVEGIRPDFNSGELKYVLTNGIFKKMCIRAAAYPSKNFVLIIDEINRGNISRIFGELITLIEPSKRLGVTVARDIFDQYINADDPGVKEEKYEEDDISSKLESTVVELPYSHDLFGVPNNLYIIATMNTADRSLVSLDTAIRRRFSFIEMLPDSDLLSNKNIEGVNLKMLLDTINNRIIQIFDREHTIGHSFFLSVNSISELKDTFDNKIIPLLQEYFYNDYSKIMKVLRRADRPVSDFIEEVPCINPVIDEPRPNYVLKSPYGSKAYIALYQESNEVSENPEDK